MLVAWRYRPRDTWVHRLDPRVKILTLVVPVLETFAAQSEWLLPEWLRGTMYLDGWWKLSTSGRRSAWPASVR